MGLKDSLVGKKRFQPFFERLYRISLRGMNYGLGGMIESSGELFIIDYVKQHTNNHVIFDVGANKGQYLESLLNAFGSSATIHSFEPGAGCFIDLQKYRRENVHLHQLALSSSRGSLTLKFDQAGSVFASVYDQDEAVIQKALTRTETIDTITLDEFCAENDINHIDFLKIDVEGHELDVLKGAEGMINRGKVKYIQFEFGPSSIAAKVYMRDFFKILSGYDIYRVLSDGIYKIEYDMMKEIFLTSNYFAIRK